MSMTFGSTNTRSVADALELGHLSDSAPGMDPELLRDLYRHARGDDGQRQLFDRDPSFTRGWVNLASPRGLELISAFVPADDTENLKQARRGTQNNLEAQPWNDLLGIDSPPVLCQVKIHGNRWGLRFRSAEPALKGKEVLNEELPPIPAVPGADGVPRVAILNADAPPAAAAKQPTPTLNSADDVLRAGGFPL